MEPNIIGRSEVGELGGHLNTVKKPKMGTLAVVDAQDHLRTMKLLKVCFPKNSYPKEGSVPFNHAYDRVAQAVLEERVKYDLLFSEIRAEFSEIEYAKGAPPKITID